MRIPAAASPITPALRAAKAYGIAPKPPAEPAAAPAGLKPSQAEQLRAVLNDEERAYFDQIAALGQLTYGPGKRTGIAPEAPRGLRIDVTG